MYLGTTLLLRSLIVKTLLLASLGGMLGAAPFLVPRPSPAEPPVHVRNSFSFTVPASVAATFPLFGADKERVWTPGWTPTFLYPFPGQDSAGMVFTVAHGRTQSVWVNTAFDAATGHVQYVYVVPGALATLIDIHVTAINPTRTTVNVTYERTALDPGANEHVHALGDHDRAAGADWEAAIRDYLHKS